MEKVALDDAFAQFEETWSPRVLTELNGQHVKAARLDGEFVWHAHEDADELFYVLDGDLTVEFREGEHDDVRLGDGELLTVPAGVEHRPVAHEETKVLLFEPAGTLNTGDADESERTVAEPEQLE
ncbi:cupin domain-containing protein [Halospeciosus flavus]|uniref:Cupin domain-containing protein n=1 Tax=Halospeciosus flavus TaxID=3032283 RepID=A0ABD5Z8S6_9EURY|nr:cupin domain-containing protein [Halospeciosus flavus]